MRIFSTLVGLGVVIMTLSTKWAQHLSTAHHLSRVDRLVFGVAVVVVFWTIGALISRARANKRSRTAPATRSSFGYPYTGSSTRTRR